MRPILNLLGISVIFLLAAGILANAATPTAAVSWSIPTTYSDGSPLPAAEIESYTVEWRRSAGGAVAGSVIVNAPATSVTVPLACGSFVFDVLTTTTPGALYPKTSSGPSAAVDYQTGVTCTPNPPSGLKVSKAS